jgi:hypothetical protein
VPLLTELGIASGLQRHVDSESMSDARAKSQSSALVLLSCCYVPSELADPSKFRILKSQRGRRFNKDAPLLWSLLWIQPLKVIIYLKSNLVRGTNKVVILELSGSYLSDCQLKNPANHACGAETADRLWHLGERLLGEEFNL